MNPPWPSTFYCLWTKGIANLKKRSWEEFRIQLAICFKKDNHQGLKTGVEHLQFFKASPPKNRASYFCLYLGV